MPTSTNDSARRVAIFAYGAAIYLLFLVTLTYLIGFVGNWIVPKSIDSGTPTAWPLAALINSGLLMLFAVQHAIMARPWFKERWTKFIPQEVERSTFVLATCAALWLMVWQWRPMPETVWHIDALVGQIALYAICVAGWLIAVYSSFLIDHFDLFGLRQVVLPLLGKDYTTPGFAMPWLYRLVRNPLMLGFLLAFWSTPHMTRGHLLFAVLITAYVFVGVRMEERDLADKLGPSYRRYRSETPMLLPRPRRQPKQANIIGTTH